MILAGPGSGKTFVITYRIHHLITQRNVPPERIAVITFTKAAAVEMQQRAIAITKQASLVAFGTFHSFFYQILRSDYRYKQISILNEKEKNSILKQILYTKYNHAKDIAGLIPILKNQISYCLNTGKFEDESTFDKETFYQLLRLYEKEVLTRNKIDFDMILTRCLKLLQENKNIREKWQAYFQYFLIDEFQDSSEIQYKIISILAEKNRNLFVVGDDDQSVYSFRGANPTIMFQFPEDYPEAKQIILNKNYRSSREILEIAVRSIQNNSVRFEKQLISRKEKNGHVIFKEADSLEEEASLLVQEILKCKKEGVPFKNMAVLCRTNGKFAYLKMKCKKAGICSSNLTSTGSIYEEEAVGEIIAYLKFSFGKRERKELLKVLNKPERYLSSMYLEEEIVDFEKILDKHKQQWGNNEVYSNLEKLWRDVDFLKELDPYGCICYILYAMGYENYYLNFRADTEEKKERAKEIFEELKLYAKEYDDVNRWLREIEWQGIASIQATANGKDRKRMQTEAWEEGINFYTYHGAKGLEFSHVFMPFINGYQVPHKKAVKKEEIEEERRMFYVAMTRAKEMLYISYIKESVAKPSIFIEELKTTE